MECPHPAGAIDNKHSAMKKPTKFGSDYNNYKGFFSLVPLDLVDREYRFLWVNVRSSGSSSDTQILNRSNWRKDGMLGLLPLEPRGGGGGVLDINGHHGGKTKGCQ